MSIIQWDSLGLKLSKEDIFITNLLAGLALGNAVNKQGWSLLFALPHFLMPSSVVSPGQLGSSALHLVPANCYPLATVIVKYKLV